MDSPQEAPKRGLGKRLGLAALSLVVAAIGAELFWRTFQSRTYGPTTNPHYVVHDEAFGWRYQPGAELRHATDEFDVRVAINAQGFRVQDPGFPLELPAVVALGDSLTFGWGVESNETFAHHLAGDLQAPVWNLAVSGFGTGQEALILGRQLDQLAPDAAPRVVLVTFCSNDVEEVARDVMYGKSKPRFVLEGEELVLENVPVPEDLTGRSHLWRSLRRHLGESTRERLTQDEVDEARRVVLHLYSAMAQESERRGAAFVVVDTGSDWLGPALADVAGVHYVDVAGALRAAAHAGEPVAFPEDGHWTARGHRIVAETIAAFLRSESLLP
jgi:hypothetical protein